MNLVKAKFSIYKCFSLFSFAELFLLLECINCTKKSIVTFLYVHIMYFDQNHPITPSYSPSF
jgi:hypothetical protein